MNKLEKSVLDKSHSQADCIFCKIVAGEIPARIIAQNDKCLAFLDVNPNSDGHALVIPKKHFRSFMTTDDDYLAAAAVMAKEVARLIGSSKLDPWGFNFVSNQESIAGQAVFHFHIHVIPKYASGEGYAYSIGRKNLRPIDEVSELIGKAVAKKAKNA